MQTLNPLRVVQALLFVGLLLITFKHTLAQNPAPVASPTTLAQPDAMPVQPSPSPTPELEPKVIRVLGNLELDDIVEINMENLEKWDETNDANKLVPYINGRAIKGNYPEELHVERGRVIYHLEITPENKEVWIDLLGAPDGLKRPVTVSVGLENGSAFESVHLHDNPFL